MSATKAAASGNGDIIHNGYANRTQTRILTLTFPDLSKTGDALKHLAPGVHCWELRADLLNPLGAFEGPNKPSPKYVEDQIRFLKSHSNLPVLFSLKQQSHGGSFPNGEFGAVLELLSLAIDLDCEYLEVNNSWSRGPVLNLVKKAGKTKILGTHDDGSNNSNWTQATVDKLLGEIDQYADIININLPAKSIEDCYELSQYTQTYQKKSQKPIVVIGTGPNGRLSRFTAPVTRVTHPSLPFPASADQPTAAEVNQALHLLGQLPKKNFYIFGHNISHSLSPTLHNAGFKDIGLPHFYRIHQSESVDASVEELINREDFGGASVTFPHKLQVGRLLDYVTLVGSKVGAINTIVVRRQDDGRRILLGDNTDWLGIKRCIDASLVTGLQSSAAMVLGAGGAARAACYAVEYLGIPELIIVNRTRSKAESMASSFTDCKTTVYETLEEAASSGSNIRLIIACVPADELDEDKIPTGLYNSDSGVLVEMAYRPQVTGMMKAAEKRPGWKIYRGVDILEEQAYEQFERWTQTSAPTLAMGAALKAKASGK